MLRGRHVSTGLLPDNVPLASANHTQGCIVPFPPEGWRQVFKCYEK